MQKYQIEAKLRTRRAQNDPLFRTCIELAVLLNFIDFLRFVIQILNSRIAVETKNQSSDRMFMNSREVNRSKVLEIRADEVDIFRRIYSAKIKNFEKLLFSSFSKRVS